MATALECYDNWKLDFGYASNSIETAQEWRAPYPGMPKTNLAEVVAAMNVLNNVFGPVISALDRIVNNGLLTNHLKTLLWKVADRYDNPLPGGEEYELTAGKIMAAWIDADADARMMTVMTLDELRREAWNKEFFSFKIAPPGGG